MLFWYVVEKGDWVRLVEYNTCVAIVFIRAGVRGEFRRGVDIGVCIYGLEKQRQRQRETQREREGERERNTERERERDLY